MDLEVQVTENLEEAEEPQKYELPDVEIDQEEMDLQVELQVHASQEVVAVEEVKTDLLTQDLAELEAVELEPAKLADKDKLELLIPVVAQEMADQL